MTQPALEQIEAELGRRIAEARARWGEELVLLAHHYQRPEVAALGDRLGDSYELARFAREAERARFILFCGVRFMAEAAEVLRRDGQRVIHPAPESGCPLADFARAEDAVSALAGLAAVRGPRGVMPLVYMNSSAELKALVGREGGAVCTSSNAPRAFRWALEKRGALLFLPDEHLGRNTARGLGLTGQELAVWDPDSPGGGLSEERIARARVFLWKGHCHVHTAFSVEDVAFARARHPGARILVHPECPEPVVLAVDGAGSTAYLVAEARAAPPGSTLVIGTEVNLVTRLARELADRVILPLRRSLCGNMFKVSLGRVAAALEALPEAEPVRLAESVRAEARLALERMLEI
jgi:quinolinate synthase